jgi:hypothetical protein
MAKAVGISPASVGRIWAAFGLQPHRAVNNDPKQQRAPVENGSTLVM